MFNILFTYRDVRYLGKLIMCLIIWDTSLFTSKDMGYLVPLIQVSSVYLRVPIKSIAA